MSRYSGFFPLWIGTTLSIFGSELAEFAISLWLLQEQQSVLGYTSMYLMIELPALLLFPFIGYLIDRFDKRKVMLITELLSGCATAGLLLLNHFGEVNTIMVYGFIAVSSIFTALRFDCYSTLIYRLVEQKELMRANSLSSLSDALPMMLAPAIGGFVFAEYGLGMVLSVDTITFLLSVLATASLFRITSVGCWTADTKNEVSWSWRSLFPDAGSLEVVRGRGALVNLLKYVGVRSILIAGTLVSLVPYYTTYYSTTVAGYMMSAGGAAMVLVSMLASWKPGIINKLPLTVIDAVYGLSFVLMTQVTHLYASAACILLAFASLRLGYIKLQTLWQISVPPQYHGRIFALRNLIRTFTTVLTYFVTGLLLEWLVKNNGILTTWLHVNGIGLFYLGIVLVTLPLLVPLGYLVGTPLTKAQSLKPKQAV